MDLMDYRRKIIANSPHLKSASGAVVTFSDGADLPLKSLVVDIDPVQSGTGDPSPTNVRPISGWNGVKVTRCGKNLLQLPTLAEINNADIVRNYRSIPIQLAPNTRYYLSTTFLNGYTANGKGMYGLITADPSGNNNWIAFAHSGRVDGKMDGTVVTNSDGLLYIRFNGATEQRLSGLYANSQIQLEAGSTATTYEPYNGVNVSIDLGQTVYGGTLDVKSGVLTVDRAIVDLGTLDWRMSGSGNTAFHYANTSALGVATNISTTLNYICSNYSIVAVSSVGTATGMAFTSANQLRIRDATYASASDFKTAMDGVTLCYEVANPTEIQLTPHQIRSLYGNNTIFADTGNTSLEYWAHP